MGRHALLALLSLSLFACAVEEGPGPDGDFHASLACADCHQGELADRELPSVPREACAGSGCHADDIPGEVTLATVRFPHRGHGATADVALGCAGCHNHQAGDEPISAGPETCGLCHQTDLSGARGEDCRKCHSTPSHAGLTTQGLAIPHAGLPWIEGGCLRCHYQVTTPVHAVSMERCEACHDDLDAVAEAGVGEDLHPLHAGNACAACHEADNHRIEAMSSAVNLTCSSCHALEHAAEIASGELDGACGECHERVHEPQQRLLLGLASTQAGTAPSDHFMDGLTCRSCHVTDASGSVAPVEGSGQACVGCHRREYATVLGWWVTGTRDRVAVVDRYVQGAETAVSGREDGDPGGAAASRARNALSLVEQGSGVHNITLSHQLLGDALAAAREAYGADAPPAPQLGRAPRQGICAYCHYRLEELGYSEGMDDAFHREVLGGR